MTRRELDEALKDHYGRSGLLERILQALRRAGVDPDRLDREDLAPCDEFHIGGRDATRELARLAEVARGMEVLDLGSGIGGPARTLAAEFECRATGLDLNEEYVRTASDLTRRLGLSDRVSFRAGDATRLPFEKASFDRVFSQHALMNVEDKPKVFREVYRVLRPGGRFALYEVCSGDRTPVHFPVPWASDPSMSFLIPPKRMERELNDAGLPALLVRDVTEDCLEWFRGRLAVARARPKNTPAPPGLQLLMGETSPEKVQSMGRNLEEGRIRVIQTIRSRL